jgi:hypothetical protein
MPAPCPSTAYFPRQLSNSSTPFRAPRARTDLFELPGLRPADFMRAACANDDAAAAAAAEFTARTADQTTGNGTGSTTTMIAAQHPSVGSAGSFFSVFQYFQDRNVALLFSPDFRAEDECDEFVARYLNAFDAPAADDADNMVPEDE